MPEALILPFCLPPERQDALRAELADLDEQIEPLERRAQDIRRILGILGTERGLTEAGDGS